MTNEEMMKLLVKQALESHSWCFPDGIPHHLEENWEVAPWAGYNNEFLFDHDFMRGIFGEEAHGSFGDEDIIKNMCSHCGDPCTWYGAPLKEVMEHEFIPTCWEYHIQKVALIPEDGRIKYVFDKVVQRNKKHFIF